MKLTHMTAVELGTAIREKKVTVEEAVQAVFDVIEEKEERLNCYVTLDREGAFRKAKEIQSRIDRGELTGPLAGVPVAIKDNMCTKGMLTTCSSRILRNFVPTYSAEAVLRLEEAGAVILGKTNMDEFAMGSTTETSAFGPTRNPWNEGHVPGGSSGGSAAAVAAEECFLALGSDTGGSIRQPASFCGVVGMKPTYGTVSRYGLIAYGSSLEQIGPIARDVRDCAAVLEAMAVRDVKDSTSVRRKGCDFTKALSEDVRGLRIGIPREYFDRELNPEIRDAILYAARALAGNGAVVEEFSFPLVDEAVLAYYVIACAQASSNLARFDGVKYGYRAGDEGELHRMIKKSRTEGFGTEVKRRIMLGTFVLRSGYYDEYYLKALQVKTLVAQAFARAFDRFDILLTPVAPTTASKMGESLKNPIQMYAQDKYTVPVNLAGLPALAIPCGTSSAGLPIGMQMIGNYFQEKTLFRAGRCFEQMRAYKKPGLCEAIRKAESGSNSAKCKEIRKAESGSTKTEASGKRKG